MRFLEAMRIDGGSEQDIFVRRSGYLWIIVLGVAAIYVAANAYLPIRFERSLLPIQFLLVGLMLPIAAFYTYWRFDARIASVAGAILVCAAFALFAGPLTYVAGWAGARFDLKDVWLLKVDHALGFDWSAYLKFVDARPQLGWAFDLAYRSLFAQQILLIIILSLLGLYHRLQVFLCAFMVGLLICTIGSIVVPAVGIYNFLSIDAATHHPNLSIATMNEHVADLLLLRSGQPMIELDTLEGIITFPSFHMTLAVLFAWGFWSVPILRWAMLGWNALMAAATPLSGGHYFVDLLAGLVVATIALLFALYVMLSRNTFVSKNPRTASPSRA